MEKKKEKRIYNPLFSHEIVFKVGAIDSIKQAKGWKSDAEMARNLGITRQYVSNLKNKRAYVTHTVIIRLAILLGNIHSNWWIFYEIVPSHKIKNNNHPAYNLMKHDKQLPYSKTSAASIMRSLDGEVEVQEN